MKRWMIVFVMILCVLVGTVSAENPSTAPTLPDLPLFTDTAWGQWAGSDNGLEVNDTSLPIDTSEMNEGFPSYRVNYDGSGSWWAFILAGNGWEGYSLLPYHANGALEFNIKGAAGGETFQIGVRDRIYGREPEPEFQPATLNSADYVTVSTAWQTVRIPLTDLVPDTSEFKLESMYLLSVNAATNNTQQVWLNNIRWTSPDPEPSYAPIKVNQLGYVTDADKYALVSGFDDELSASAGTLFEVRHVSDDSVAYSGALTLVTALDSTVSGERVLKADFSALTDDGDYYVAVAGSADSVPFTINNNIYDELIIDSSRYFFYQRQGIALSAENAGVFARDIGHPMDSNAALESGGGARDVSQGWYDAGDYGKYVNAGAVAVNDMLWAYELFPDQFSDNQFNIPESGNGIPDILDEIKWETDWLLKMQDPVSGGFYHMVQGTQETLPDEATDARYIVDVDGARTNVRPTSSSASTVGALAHAAIVFRPIDADYADELLESAENGWAYLEANPTDVASVPGPYTDSDDSDNRFWAAGALYRATGNPTYSAYVEANYLTVEAYLNATGENAYFVPTHGILGFLNYAWADNPDPTVQNWFATEFDQWKTMMVNRNTTSTWHTTILDNDYFWGSNMMVLNTPLVLAVGSKALGTYDQDVIETVRQAANYILGINPLQFSYVSGYGENSVENIFSTIWSHDGIAEIPKGYLAGGPNEYTNPFLYSNFAGKQYIDSDGLWTVNEQTVYWNSPLVFDAALLAAEAGPTTPTAVTHVTHESTSSINLTLLAVMTLLLGLIAALVVYKRSAKG